MRRHELDLVSLLAGIVFLGLAVLHLTGGHLDGRWVLPTVLVCAGLAGVLGVLGRGRGEADLPAKNSAQRGERGEGDRDSG